MKTIEHYKAYIDELVTQLNVIKQRQDNEKKQLTDLRDALKSAITVYKEVGDLSYLHLPLAVTNYQPHLL